MYSLILQCILDIPYASQIPCTNCNLTYNNNLGTTTSNSSFTSTSPGSSTATHLTVIVIPSVALALAIMVIIMVITIFWLANKCKKKREFQSVVVADNSLSLDQSQKHDVNVKPVINGVVKGHIADLVDSDGYTCIGDQHTYRDETEDQNEVRYEQVEPNLNSLTQHFVRPLYDVQQESEAHLYEQVPCEKTNHKKINNIMSGSKSPSAHQYAVPMGDTVGKSATTTWQQQGGTTRYDTITTYEQAAVYEKAATYQVAATYERAMTYHPNKTSCENIKELRSNFNLQLPSAHQYTVPMAYVSSNSATTTECQQQGGETRYDTIATYELPAVYEEAATYQVAATYESVMTYEAVPCINDDFD